MSDTIPSPPSHDSTSPLLKIGDTIRQLYIGVEVTKIYHYSYKREIYTIDSEAPKSATFSARDIVEIADGDIFLRGKLIDIATTCRELADEMIRHAERLEVEAGKEVLIVDMAREDRAYLVKSDDDSRTISTSKTDAKPPSTSAPGSGSGRRSRVDVRALNDI